MNREPLPTAARRSPLKTNEILDRIFSFLDQRTLKCVAARVCGQWLYVAIRRFERHLIVSEEDSKTWKDLPRRLSEANVLTVGKPFQRMQTPRNLKQWHKMISQLEKALLETNTVPNNSGKDVTTASHQPVYSDISGARTNKPREGLDKQIKAHLQIKAATLNFEWWEVQETALALLFPSPLTTLRELTLSAPRTSVAVSIEGILNQFPNLLHLSLSSHKYRRAGPGRRIYRSFTFLQRNSVVPLSDDCEDHPLRTLCLDYLCLDPNNVASHLPRLGNLIEFKFLNVRPLPSVPPSFSNNREDPENQLFWQSVAKHCPKLKLIHLQLDRPQGGIVPVALFPQVCDWSFDWYQGTANAMLRLLRAHIMENRLTTLKIQFSQPSPGTVGCAYDHVSDKLLCNLLLASPHLQHLDTGPREWSTLVLTMPIVALWACRGLLTLSMRFNTRIGGGHSESRHIFGYLSRACPNLEELSLRLECDGFSARTGLCLLTRLKRLQQLEVHGICLDHSNSEKPDWGPHKEDFCWIQGGPAPRLPSSSRLISGLASLFSSAPIPLCEKDYLDSIEKLREWSRLFTFNGDGMNSLSVLDKYRPMVQQQQKDNGYRSDYDRPIPMVDGVEGLDHCGSYLDIEACLQAQLFHFRQQHSSLPAHSLGPRAEAASTETVTVAPTSENRYMTRKIAPEMTLPWPVMRQIRFIHGALGPHCPRNIAKSKRYVEQCSKIIQQMRPDIRVLH
ncbi:hypothetical protein EMPS_03192 [Entomortierella parvispora]|uniref:F-box domain-containing protein n=1 Tax=Entomortierella parvispora TaxID=205924 RepID=A0A9P3H6B7_9FUNG|nr:hypothetical protein EMPS_03192 [Entomortierella parvispora]